MNTQPTTPQLLKEAKSKGLVYKASGTYNGARAFRLDAASTKSHGYPADPHGRGAALFTAADIARKLGYPV